MADQQAPHPEALPRLASSSCLLGEEVRFDGGHKRDDFLINTLGRFVERVPVCPEAEIDVCTLRQILRLDAAPSGPRLLQRSRPGRDHWLLPQSKGARGRMNEDALAEGCER